MNNVNLTDHFLIAMPSLGASFFANALVYIAEHNSQGAFGVIVNRPLDMRLLDLLEKIDVTPLDKSAGDLPVLVGGPVQKDRGFVLHRPLGQWQTTLVVNQNVGLTSSRDVLQAFAQDTQPRDLVVTLGHAGWSAGQLEQELKSNAWLTVAADTSIIFDLPYEERLSSAMEKLGVDATYLINEAGHA
ncbi:MAG: YqgE/AlgH family protein [Pseudomonadota bacterium]